MRFYAITYRFLSTPKQFQTYLFDSVPSLIFATLALANPHNALLVRFYASLRFTSCVAYQCFAIASPIDATRCFCFSLPHHAPLLLCALACVNACWRVLARVASARRFYANHYLACAFPLFSFVPQCSTVLLRFLDSLYVAIAVHRFTLLLFCDSCDRCASLSNASYCFFSVSQFRSHLF